LVRRPAYAQGRRAFPPLTLNSHAELNLPGRARGSDPPEGWLTGDMARQIEVRAVQRMESFSPKPEAR